MICFVDRLSHLFGWFLLIGYRTRLVGFFVDRLSNTFGEANGTTHGSFPTIEPVWLVFVDRLSHTFGEANGTTHGSFPTIASVWLGFC